MTKKNFIALAETMQRTRPDNTAPSFAQWKDDVQALADFCQSQNPQFDRERWLSYIAGTCEKNGGKR